MAASFGLELKELASSVRFIKGYRYLDRCGEALVRLEGVLDEGWIPVESAPSGGQLRNDLLGMLAQFNSDSVTVRQQDFLAFDKFQDQACKIYDTLRSTFEIESINAPSLRAIMQKGFDEAEEADRFVRDVKLCQPQAAILAMMEGSQSALTFTLCTEQEREWRGAPVLQRRRLEVSAIRQLRQPPLDNRLIKRVRLLPKDQQQAMRALMRLRTQMPEIKPAAAQFDLEHSFETEFGTRTFDLPFFFEESWSWVERCKSELTSCIRKQLP